MAKVLTGISGNLISAASAGFAPTNSADVSAIASAYQVVSATGTQLYAGTAHVTSINGDPISASRAGNAANASMANSAYYDGTGRLISALPDEATVSSIASSYTESAVSSKADSSSLSSYALSSDVSGVIDTVSSNSASWGGGATGDYVETSALVVSIGSANTASGNSITQGSSNSARSLGCAFGSNSKASNRGFAQGAYSVAFNNSMAQGQFNTASACSFAQGTYNTASATSFARGLGISSVNQNTVFGTYNLRGDGSTASGNSAAFAIGDGTASGARHDLMLVTKDGEITMYSSTADTVGLGLVSSIRAISANAGGIDSATCSAIASSYAESAVSSKADSSSLSSYALSADVSGTVDVVSTQSANWGGSALALSAGPGISLTMVGNTLVISTAGV